MNILKEEHFGFFQNVAGIVSSYRVVDSIASEDT